MQLVKEQDEAILSKEICSSSAFSKTRKDKIQVGGQFWSESILH